MRFQLVIALGLAVFAAPAAAEVHEVRMLNRNDTGGMVYEPDFLRVAPGDTVVFRATNPSHNAASIDGMLPEGAARFMGKINEEIEITLDVPGTYGVKCSPHYTMGMVMLIEVGEGAPDLTALPDNLPPAVVKRFDEIMARAVQ